MVDIERSADDRWLTIRALWKENQWLYVLTGIFIGILISPFLNLLSADLRGLLEGLVPEATGIVFTVLVLERLSERRSERQLREQLVREMGTPDRGIAARAVRELQVRGWLEDGSLQGEKFWESDLHEVRFQHADLRNASFWKANLGTSDFYEANLEGAELVKVNLSNADLSLANLSKAVLAKSELARTDLSFANLQGAKLQNANLRGARLNGVDLRGANLTGANLENVTLGPTMQTLSDKEEVIREIELPTCKLDENTIMPDGNRWVWGTGFQRFTDPEHPEFWRSSDPESPAYSVVSP